ncbi:GDP-L-fucose synthase family protein [Castellaniella sp.]|uniref:GDP-L-fucose synthase n=1 Tax=Castellaniella sp. TaxID=1955812 RepID=UPI00355EEDF2
MGAHSGLATTGRHAAGGYAHGPAGDGSGAAAPGSHVPRIYVAGHQGMVGSALVRHLQARGGGATLLTAARAQLDLRDPAAVRAFFAAQAVDEVYLAAARVGGIHANQTRPADFLYENLMIQCNVIQAAHEAGVQKLLFLGSSCIYPRLAAQPMAESALLTGSLEPTNEPYAVAKIAGIKLCESYHRQHGRDYRSVMPTNLYGPGDNFHPRDSHVIPALMRRLHEARMQGLAQVAVWGSGRPRREFLHVDDMAAACVHVMDLPADTYWGMVQPMLSHINIGTGTDVSIAALATLLAEVVGYRGKIHFDPTQPDGTPRKLLDVGRLQALGWRPQIPLRTGLAQTYAWFQAQGDAYRGAEQ